VGDVWFSSEPTGDGGYRTVYAPVAGTPEPLTADATSIDRDQAAAIVHDLASWLEGDASPTARRLARALREAGAPTGVVAAALAGRYDEWVSDLEFPTLQLIDDLTAAGMTAFAARVESGEFDAPAPAPRLRAAA
jgi:hypothetical protein